MQSGEALLDVLQPLLWRLGCRGRTSREVGLHLEENALTCFDVQLAAAQLMGVGREAHLGVLERCIVRSRHAARVPADTRYRIRELALAFLDGANALRELHAAILIARKRSYSPSIETGSSFCFPNKATRR